MCLQCLYTKHMQKNIKKQDFSSCVVQKSKKNEKFLKNPKNKHFFTYERPRRRGFNKLTNKKIKDVCYGRIFRKWFRCVQ